MSTIPKKFGFIRTTLALWAANVFAGRAGVVTDAPMGSSTSETWAWHDGTGWKFAARRGESETFSDLSISGLTNGCIPFVSTAGGLLGDSSLSEDAASVKCAKPLTLNGATRSAWSANLVQSAQLSNAATLGVFQDGSGDGVEMWSNVFYGTEYRAINAKAGNYPCRLYCSAGELAFISSVTQPVTGGVINDMVERFAVNRFGQASQWTSELVTSGRYIKVDDTTIGPSAAAKASLLNGATTGFVAVTDPAQRWNAVAASSETVLKGNVSSAANQVLVFELYRNGAVSATLTLPARSYGTATPWRLVIDQVVRADGSTGMVRVKMRAYVTADNANSAASCYDMSATLTGIDLTVAHTWDAVCTIPNNASNSITCDYAKKVG